MSNIKSTKDGLVEKSSGKKIISPLDTNHPYAKEIIVLLSEKNLTLGEAKNIISATLSKLRDTMDEIAAQTVATKSLKDLV